jgi:hypothetical protein
LEQQVNRRTQMNRRIQWKEWIWKGIRDVKTAV